MAQIIKDPIYGEIRIADPILLELIDSPALRRLKGIDQNVTGRLTTLPWGQYSRFDHSIGVMHIIKKFHGSLEEQIAGLLHDISHTAFSHAMDFVFDNQEVQDFHEKYAEYIIEKYDLPKILEKFDFAWRRVAEPKNFSILEQDIPDLCADRIDYALKTFHQSQGYEIQTIADFLKYISVHDGKLAFVDIGAARSFAEKFLKADRTAWGGNALVNTAYHIFALIVKHAYENGRIQFDDFFLTDGQFLDKLGSPYLAEIEKIKNIALREVEEHEPHDLHLNAKIRYVDPPVSTANTVQRLSALDPVFKKNLATALDQRKQGNYVKILNKQELNFTFF